MEYTIKNNKTEDNIMRLKKRSNKQLVDSAFILKSLRFI
jgi:hypothetical protein